MSLIISVIYPTTELPASKTGDSFYPRIALMNYFHWGVLKLNCFLKLLRQCTDDTRLQMIIYLRNSSLFLFVLHFLGLKSLQNHIRPESFMLYLATQWTRPEHSRLFGNWQKQLYACVFNLVYRRVAEHAEGQGSLLTCRSNLTRCEENHTSLVQWGNLSPKYSSNALWCLLCCRCHFPSLPFAVYRSKHLPFLHLQWMH